MAIDKSMIKRLATQCRIKVINDGMMYVADKEPFEAYTRAIESAARAELLAGVEPAKGQYFICTKCGMHGVGNGAQHSRHDGTLCGYLAHSEGPYYTADQLAAAVAKAKAEQREADAKVCEGYALRTRRYLDDDMTACKLANAIREGGK